jgi:hypothetical protein
MTESYSLEDRERTGSILDAVVLRLRPWNGNPEGPWRDLTEVAVEMGLRLDQVGTLKSKLRELNDKHHTEQPYRLETKPNPDRPRGAWLYRLVLHTPEPVTEPMQMELLEA